LFLVAGVITTSLIIYLGFWYLPHMQELLLSYNVGIPFDQREKHMNAKAAEFVGLRLPAAPESPQIVP